MAARQVWVCARCAVGACDECRVSLAAGRVTKRCACRHGARRSVIARTGDPRPLDGGAIVGGSPSSSGDVLIDATHGVLVDDVTVARIDNPSDGRTAIAMLLEGRLNQSTDRASVMYLLGGDGAAAIVTDLVGLAARMGPEFEADFREALDRRIAAEDLWPATPQEVP